MLRASVAAEAAGIPTVSLVCEGFEGQARATARGLGFDGVALAVLPGHVDTQSVAELTENLVRHTVPAIVAGLTAAVDVDANGERRDEPAALDVVVSGTLEEVHEHFAERGWSDGLPFVPPTVDRVEAMLDPLGFDPWRTVGVARPSGRDMTLWSIAVNGVMAGCRPEHMPVLVAIARTFADPRYGVEHSGNTTGADPLVILDGPIADDLGLNHGPGAMRHGGPNATIGRFVRLYLRNVHGFTPDEHDKATFGNPTKSVLAEDLDCLREIGWGPLASGFGFGRTDDAVVIGRINSGAIIGSVFGGTPAEIVPYLADGIARVTGWDLTHVHGLGQGQQRPLLVLSPLLARVFGRAGWSRRDVQQALFAHARIPARRFEQLIGEWSNLTTGRRTLTDLAADGLVPPVYAESDDPDRLVPVVDDPSKILIAVSGDPNRANAFAMSHDGPHGDWTATAVDRTPSADLLCRVPTADGGTADCT